jgi:ubiquinone/menaquinone biosynthesis C-methylase UbiE
MSTPLSDLHAPLLPILRHVLATAGLPRRATLLDLACGAGEKHGLLAQVCQPARIIALDRDRAALQRLWEDQRPTTNGQRPGSSASIRATSQYALPHSQCSIPLAGDAHALPLRSDCCDAACCIAALGLFADRAAALRELRRVLRLGGAAVVVTATRRWAELVRWPEDLAAQIVQALYPAFDGEAQTQPAQLYHGERREREDERPHGPNLVRALWEPGAPEDVAGELVAALEQAGFAAVRARAFLLDGTPPAQAELALLPWAALRPRLQRALSPAALAHCEMLAADPEIELCDIALVGRGI